MSTIHYTHTVPLMRLQTKSDGNRFFLSSEQPQVTIYYAANKFG